MKIRIKVRLVSQEWTLWLKGIPPLGKVWVQIAVTVPAILGLDFEVSGS